jgi:hypothetical protein
MFFSWSASTAFDQDLSDWDISSSTSMKNMLRNQTLSTANYDTLLIGWSTLDPGETRIPSSADTDLTFPTLSTYTTGGAAEAARDTLIGTYGWSITEDTGI